MTAKNTTPAPAPTKTYREVTGTKAAPATEYRRVRQEKGYGRVALAAALGITTSALWRLENHVDPSTSEGKAALKALKALPSIKRTAAPAKAVKAADKAASSDLL
jgi:hypothetical protein